MKLKHFSVLVLLASCDLKTESTASDETDYTKVENSVVSDGELQSQATSLVIADALDTLSDTNEGNDTSSSLALLKTSFSKTCETEDDSAIVTVKRSIDRESNFETRRYERNWSITGSSTITRKYTDDTAVTCQDKHANISWLGDITGLKLESDAERSMSVTSETTFKKRSTEKSRSSERQVKATRNVEWTVHTTSGANFIRTKSVSLESERSHTVQNSQGDERTLAFTIKTEDEEPLVIDVERVSATGQLVSKTIKSGTLLSDRKSDSRISTSFTDLKMSFVDDECSLQSGSIDFKVFKDGEDEASSHFQLTLTEGAFTMKNVDSGETLADYELEGCDAADYASDI